MSNDPNEGKNNVVPLAPAIRRAMAEDQVREYPGASIATAMMLQQEGFDHAALMANGNWIELRIIAKFSETGAMFHTMQSRLVRFDDEAQGEQNAEQGGDPATDAKPSSEAHPEQSQGPAAPQSDGSPAMRALRLMAEMHLESRNYYIEKISSADLETMSQELATATPDEVYHLVYEESPRDMASVFPKSDAILEKLSGGE